jgi:hypothetical protein
LQVGTDGQGTSVELFQFSDGSIHVEQTDMADNQSLNAGVAGDATNDRR